MVDCHPFHARVERMCNKHISTKDFLSGPKQLLLKCVKQTKQQVQVKSLKAS